MGGNAHAGIGLLASRPYQPKTSLAGYLAWDMLMVPPRAWVVHMDALACGPSLCTRCSLCNALDRARLHDRDILMDGRAITSGSCLTPLR